MKSLILTICLLVACVGCARAQKNLVTNGDFEDDFYGWNNNGGTLTPWDVKAGKKSCAITTTNTEKWIGLDQTIRIPKKVTNIQFSAWIKAINVVKGANDWDGAIISVVFLDNGDKEFGEGQNIARITGDEAWTQVSKIIKMPEKAVSFKILVAMGNASGTMIVDDIAAKVVTDEPAIK